MKVIDPYDSWQEWNRAFMDHEFGRQVIGEAARHLLECRSRNITFEPKDRSIVSAPSLLLSKSIGGCGEFVTYQLVLNSASDIGFVLELQSRPINLQTRRTREASKYVFVVLLTIQSPPAACATALNNARPLFIVSSHSACGSES